MKKPVKSNIMLLVMFVMFVSSFLGLLVTQYVRDMINISGLFTKYYTTYFHAYGGLEMGLSMINYRVENDIDKKNPFGYEDSASYSSYGNCNGNTCGFTMNIDSRGPIITDSYEEGIDSCATAVAQGALYTIDSGEGFIIPLFYDVSTGFSVADYEVIEGNNGSPSEFETLSPQLYSKYQSGGTGEEYIVRIIDEEVLNYNVYIEPEVGDGVTPEALAVSGLIPYESSEGSGIPVFGENKNYLIVANATGSVKQFCLELAGSGPLGAAELPQKYMKVQSVAEFGNISVAFSAIKTNELPSYLIYGTINP